MDTLKLRAEQRAPTRRALGDRKTSEGNAAHVSVSTRLDPSDGSDKRKLTRSEALYESEHEIAGLPFCSISERPDGGLSIGGLIAEHTIARHPLVARRFPSLSAAILAGTDTSSLRSHAGLSAQSLHILRELKAQIRVEGREGVKMVPLAEIDARVREGNGRTSLVPPGEVFLSIELAPLSAQTRKNRQ